MFAYDQDYEISTNDATLTAHNCHVTTTTTTTLGGGNERIPGQGTGNGEVLGAIFFCSTNHCNN